MATKERKRQFSYAVTVLNVDGSRGCSLLSGAPTLAENVTRAYHSVAFYLREELGYPAVILQMSEQCGECGGTGYASLINLFTPEGRAALETLAFPELIP